jgi:hypothetical protein
MSIHRAMSSRATPFNPRSPTVDHGTDKHGEPHGSMVSQPLHGTIRDQEEPPCPKVGTYTLLLYFFFELINPQCRAAPAPSSLSPFWPSASPPSPGSSCVSLVSLCSTHSIALSTISGPSPPSLSAVGGSGVSPPRTLRRKNSPSGRLLSTLHHSSPEFIGIIINVSALSNIDRHSPLLVAS